MNVGVCVCVVREWWAAGNTTCNELNTPCDNKNTVIPMSTYMITYFIFPV